MCLVLMALEQHVDYPLVILFNRDEQYSRSSAVLHSWVDSDIVAPQDLVEGGTWFGMNRAGAWAGVTAYRSGKALKPRMRSRGLLVSDFLQGNISPQDYAIHLQATSQQYNGFNLIFGNPFDVYYFSSRLNQFQKVESGFHALSNAELNTPWPKTVKGLAHLKSQLLDKPEIDKSALLQIMADRMQAPSKLLPNTGIDFSREKKISAIHVANERDGTCSTSLLLLNRNKEVTFTEISYHDPFDEGHYEEVKFKLYE